RLVGYTVAEPGADVDLDAVRERLAERLPLHMVPSALMALDELPLTSNGKLDQNRLPDPQSRPARHSPPRTDTERRLAEAWRDLLGAEQLGVADNFFHLGGNSLQATQLVARVRDEFGVSLQPRELFLCPALGQLAARIDDACAASHASKAGQAASPVTPIAVAGDRPPLFFVHPVGGAVTPYARLASLLGDDQPFYGLEDPGLNQGASATSLPDAAARYVAAIREVQPKGPYHLGGWSFGGAAALEMACQLRAAGEQVALVAALDTGLPAERHAPDPVELLAWFVRDVAGVATAAPPPLDLDALRRQPAAEQVEAVLTALEAAGLASADVREQLRARIEVFSANSRAFLAHQPRPYDGRLALLSAADHLDREEVDRWRTVAAGFEHHVTPGDHYTMLQPPHVTTLAGVLRGCLDRALDDQPGDPPAPARGAGLRQPVGGEGGAR
ncbi:MAG: hypothetical protein GEU94_06630, partial [Micromonosporaceae bacterium]|nr:hypothetical protein [Micromonosporaceae bacterium]